MKKSRIILVILAVLFLVLVGLAIGKPMTMFMSEPEKFQMWVESKGIWGILAFIGMNAAQVLFAVIPEGVVGNVPLIYLCCLAGLNPSIKSVPYGKSILFVRAVGEL